MLLSVFVRVSRVAQAIAKEVKSKNETKKEKIILERPETVNLLNIFSALSDEPLEKIVKIYSEKQFSIFKKDLGELAVSVLGPLNKKIKKLKDDQTYMETLLDQGAERAREISRPIVEETKKIVGYA